MPKWWVHNKWAAKFGIRSEILNWINDLIDNPHKHVQGWFVEHVGHDWGRHRKWEKMVLENLAEQGWGYQGVLAVHLHHLLDILDVFTNPQKSQQMDAFKKAVREAKDFSGTVSRLDGSPSRKSTERIIPAVARRIQGILGKCYICGGSLGGEPHIELESTGTKNICAHLKCLGKEEASKLLNQMQTKSDNRMKAVEKPTLNLMQVKEKVMEKAVEMELNEEVIEFVMKYFWEILCDIENSRDFYI